jgi:hypothetical protein
MGTMWTQFRLLVAALLADWFIEHADLQDNLDISKWKIVWFNTVCHIGS